MRLTSSTISYWRAATQPRYSLTFAFPLLVAYEALAFALSHDALTGAQPVGVFRQVLDSVLRSKRR
jgi:hypothetical protein